LESLVRFFEGKDSAGQLLFCTENVKDFCLPLDDDNLAIHPLMREGLPPTNVFKNLRSLVGFVKEHKTVEEPAAEEVNEALEREKTRRIEEEATSEIRATQDAMAQRAMEGLAYMDRAEAAHRAMERIATPEIEKFAAIQQAMERMAAPQVERLDAIQKAIERMVMPHPTQPKNAPQDGGSQGPSTPPA
jgi:hypothetical protein